MGTVQVCASVLGIPVSESLLEKWRRWYSPALQPFPIDDVIAVERAQLPHRVMQPSDEVRDTFFLYQGEWAWLQENEFRALPAELRERLLASRRRATFPKPARSEEHTSELQSRGHLVCRRLLEKKNTTARSRSQK